MALQREEKQKSQTAGRVWWLIAVWLFASLTIYSILGQFTLVLFTLTFGVVFPLAVYSLRSRIGGFVERHGLQKYPVFAIAAFLISLVEEYYVFALGGRIAFHNLLVDLIAVPVEWIPWYATWYLYLSRKYSYSESEALLLAGTTGILFEYVGSGEILTSPTILALSLPLYIAVYSALFIIPLQFIRFSGQNTSRWKYPLSVLLPYFATVPVALLIYVLSAA